MWKKERIIWNAVSESCDEWMMGWMVGVRRPLMVQKTQSLTFLATQRETKHKKSFFFPPTNAFQTRSKIYPSKEEMR